MVNEIEIINMGKTFVLGAVAIGSICVCLVYLAGRFNFSHELPSDKIKKVIDDLLEPVTTLGKMEKLYPSSSGKNFQTAEKEPVNSHTEYVEIKTIRSVCLDSKHLPLSRLEKMVDRGLRNVAAHLRSVKGIVGSRTEPYDTLEEIKQKGEELGAEGFSFQSVQMIHGDYVFNVLYHKAS